MTTIEVLNQIDAVPESSVVIDVAMSNPIYRGPKGEPGDDYTLTAEDIAEIAGEIDLSEYAKLDDIPDTTGFALKSDIPDTSNFITADDLPDTTGFATEEFVNEKINEIPSPDLSEYAKISDIPDTSNNATYEYVDNAVASIESPNILKLYTDVIPTAEQWELLKTMADTGASPGPIFVNDLPVLSYDREGSLSWGSLSLNLIYGKPMDYQNSYDITMGLQYTVYEFKKNDVPALPRLTTTAYLSEDSISLKSFRTPNKAKRLNEVLIYLDDNKADVSALENYYSKTEVDGLIPDTSNFTTEEDVNALISNALGVIENGTY